MKKLLTALVCIATFCAVNAQKSTIKVTFSGMNEGTSIIVTESDNGRAVPTDTLMLDKKKQVTLTRNLSQPALIVFVAMVDKNPMLHILAEPGEQINLQAKYVQPYNMFTIESTSGSLNMQLYKQYTKMVAEGFATGDMTTVGSQLETLIKTNPKTLMSSFLVTYFDNAFEQHYNVYKLVYDNLKGRYSSHELVKYIEKRLSSALLPGTEVPEIALPSPEGTTLHLSDLRGKVVLIDFWASWCRPCRMENPNVVRLYSRYHDRGFEVFSVSLDNTREAWIKAIADDHLSWPNHVSDLRGWQSVAARTYGIQSIPSTILIDASGKVIARNLRGSELENTLKDIFDR
ncbi:MAG: redoxin domain-containing protein [Bacteroidales bacterium]|nr:redoxin domain-containing protein [Bacteroidales bacterium]